MPLVVAQLVADGEIVNVAVAAFAQGLNVFKRRRVGQYMFTADPARHQAMELTGNRLVNFAPRVGEFAHVSALPTQGAAARINRSRTPSQSSSLGNVSTQINLTPCASKSRSTAKSCCAVACASSGMRRYTSRDD